jgi:tRNA G10  N-methylase Trm11
MKLFSVIIIIVSLGLFYKSGKKEFTEKASVKKSNPHQNKKKVSLKEVNDELEKIKSSDFVSAKYSDAQLETEARQAAEKADFDLKISTNSNNKKIYIFESKEIHTNQNEEQIRYWPEFENNLYKQNYGADFNLTEQDKAVIDEWRRNQ